jgi:cytochrome c-type biogenesis protein CcmH
MTEFVLIAVLMTLVVVGAVLLPLLIKRDGAPMAMVSAIVSALLIAGGSAALYPAWSKWNWAAPAAAPDSPVAMVGRLARRLETEPNDLQGWLVLGRSYGVIEQYPMSVRAYQRADRLAGGQNAEALTGLAEALVLAQQSDLNGRAGQLFEKALALDSKSTKALFYSAIAALERGEKPLALERFVKLLSANPPPEVRRIIESQVQALQGATATAQSATAATNGAPAKGGSGVVGKAVAIPVHITLAAAVSAKARPGAPLFLLARLPGQRGPPLAARRLEAKFPQDLELLSSDAMIAGTGFAEGQEVEIVARVSNGGSAAATSGDPFGSVVVKAGSRKRTAIQIDQVTP